MIGGIKITYRFFKKFMTFPSFLFVLLWLGINTGPWVFRHTPQTMMEYVNYFRTLIPYINIYLLGMGLLVFYRGRLISMDMSARMWVFYGLVGLLASLNSPHPFDASYWALAYLAVFAVSKLFLTRVDTLTNIMTLNHLTWLMTSAFLLVILNIYGDALIGQASGYGVVNRVHMSDMALPRASGVARFASVPAIVAFVLMLNSKHIMKLFWGVLFVATAYLVYFMQSRGAIVALAGTIVLVMAFVGRHAKLMGILASVLLILAFMVDVIPKHTLNDIIAHLERGQDMQELGSLTGRTRAWEHAVKVTLQSPVIGYGFQADRWLIGEHVHNAYLYAFMTTGFLGMILFVLGYFYAWLKIIKNLKNIKIIRKLGQATMFAQTVGIVTFFTLRSIPEVSGAIFAVDLVVLVPAILYLGVLNREIVKEKNMKKQVELDIITR